jgi:hypothetical protein
MDISSPDGITLRHARVDNPWKEPEETAKWLISVEKMIPVCTSN